MEQRIFAGITVAILLLSSLLIYFNEDDEKNDDYYMGDNGLVPVWKGSIKISIQLDPIAIP